MFADLRRGFAQPGRCARQFDREAGHFDRPAGLRRFDDHLLMRHLRIGENLLQIIHRSAWYSGLVQQINPFIPFTGAYYGLDNLIYFLPVFATLFLRIEMWIFKQILPSQRSA